jgi:uncharacterized protein (TIGR00251 family)
LQNTFAKPRNISFALEINHPHPLASVFTRAYPEKNLSLVRRMTTLLNLKVSPGSAVNKIMDWNAGILKVRIKAPPEKGKANKELIRFLAKLLGIAPANLELVSGEASRNKRVRIHGMTESAVRRILTGKS